MKVAVIGPQNTGKTTFLKDFLKEFKNYKTTKLSYRDIITRGKFKIDRLSSEKSQKAIMDFLFKEITTTKNDNMIFDRCLIDNYVYTYCAHLDKKVSKDFVHRTKRKMYDHLDYLDALFFIPTAASVRLDDDGFRDVDRVYIDLVNKVFMEVLFEVSNRTNVPIFVISGTREERLKQAREKIM
jgi:nicotinamide riboside kinase